MSEYSDTQLQALAQLMPRIIHTLRAADDAGRCAIETAQGTQWLPPEKGVATLKDLNVGALCDALDDWCWHAPAHGRGESCDNAVAR